jgi:hypothetical protein
VSQRSEWRRFVERRRRELYDGYPCAAPTFRRRCPKHHASVGPVTGICKPCRDELYEQLAAEYVNPTREESNMNTFDPESQYELVSVSDIRITAVDRIRPDGVETIRIDREVSLLTGRLGLPADAAVEIQQVVDRWRTYVKEASRDAS